MIFSAGLWRLKNYVRTIFLHRCPWKAFLWSILSLINPGRAGGSITCCTERALSPVTAKPCVSRPEPAFWALICAFNVVHLPQKIPYGKKTRIYIYIYKKMAKMYLQKIKYFSIINISIQENTFTSELLQFTKTIHFLLLEIK